MKKNLFVIVIILLIPVVVYSVQIIANNISLDEIMECNGIRNTSCEGKEYRLQIHSEDLVKNYTLAYKEFGECSYINGTDSISIFCDSRLDCNADGICQPGESCIAFSLSEFGVIRLMKNSRSDFVEHDKTFLLEKIDMKVSEAAK